MKRINNIEKYLDKDGYFDLNENLGYCPREDFYIYSWDIEMNGNEPAIIYIWKNAAYIVYYGCTKEEMYFPERPNQIAEFPQKISNTIFESDGIKLTTKYKEAELLLSSLGYERVYATDIMFGIHLHYTCREDLFGYYREVWAKV